ncbi:MAG TPA: amidase [Longimicrobiales bacterium]|nr:amidase [Longimicrobiales bacterium]
MNADLLAAPARDLARAARDGVLSPLDMVEAHIARIEAVNPLINAVVAERFDEARAEARALASVDPAGRALYGVPFTVKEMVAVTGMPMTFGCQARRGRVADRDATVVARLRAAGAIPLGVTNVPEWGMWSESYNHVYGRTNNPWDLARTPGGSSGGEGAIVGAGGSAFGIGSDIGGSVRMPAAFCGVYGHKPTTGLLPLTGHYPVYASGSDAALDRTAPYVTLGTLTRSAADIAPLLRVMMGGDGVDPNVDDALVLRDPADVDWRGRRVALLANPSIALARSADGAVQRAVERAAAILAARGAEVVEAPRDLLRRAGDAWFAALQSSSPRTFTDVLGDGAGVPLVSSMIAASFGAGRYSWPALFFVLGEKLGTRSERSVRRALAELERMRERLHALIGDGGVLLLPAHPRAVPAHNSFLLRPFDFLVTAAFNALRVPATVAPLGFDDGLPLSVQVVGTRGSDHLTIAAALCIEEENGPWRPAEPRNPASRRAGTRDPALHHA